MRMEDGRKRTNDLTEQIKSLKGDQVDLVERRKELWREDTRLQSLVTHASDEKRSAENNLASMMDKVWFYLDFPCVQKLMMFRTGYRHGSTCRR